MPLNFLIKRRRKKRKIGYSLINFLPTSRYRRRVEEKKIL